MVRHWLPRILIMLECIIVIGLAFHAPLTVWLGTIVPAHIDVIKAWKEILMGVCLALVLAAVTARHQWSKLYHDTLIRLTAVYAFIHLLLLAWQWQGIGAAVSGMLIDLRYVLFFILIYVTVRLYPEAKRYLLYAAAVSATVVIGFAFLQLTVLPVDILSHIGYSKSTIAPYLTVDQNNAFIRINSTLRGPNPLGAYAGVVLAVAAAWTVSKYRTLTRMQWAMVAGVVVMATMALWASYSRSALVAAGVGIVAACIAARVARIRPVWWISGIAVCVVVAGAVFLARDTAFVSNVVLHNNPTGGSVHKSDEGHASSLRDGMVLMAQQPLGGGIGSTGSASLRTDSPIIIENQYLFIAHESGWLGLLCYLCLFAVVMIELWRRRGSWLAAGVFGGGIVLACIGLLLPVWVDDTVSITWWALAALVCGGDYERKKRTRK